MTLHYFASNLLKRDLNGAVGIATSRKRARRDRNYLITLMVGANGWKSIALLIHIIGLISALLFYDAFMLVACRCVIGTLLSEGKKLPVRAPRKHRSAMQKHKS